MFPWCFFRLHFVLNLLPFALEKFVNLGTIEWWWPWRAYNFLELGSLHIARYTSFGSPPQGISSCRRKRFCYCLFPCWIWYLPKLLLLQRTIYFFVNSREFSTFIHHWRRWFSLKHVSVSNAEKNHKRKGKKRQRKKNFFYCFLSV